MVGGKDGRPRSLQDVEKIKKIVDEYITLEQPTFVGLCRKLGVCANTVYHAMDRDDDISEELKRAWMYLIDFWEHRLCEKNYVAAIFYLKTVRKFGFRWNDQPEETLSKPNTLHIEIVDKKDKAYEIESEQVIE